MFLIQLEALADFSEVDAGSFGSKLRRFGINATGDEFLATIRKVEEFAKKQKGFEPGDFAFEACRILGIKITRIKAMQLERAFDYWLADHAKLNQELVEAIPQLVKQAPLALFGFARLSLLEAVAERTGYFDYFRKFYPLLELSQDPCAIFSKLPEPVIIGYLECPGIEKIDPREVSKKLKLASP